jgi:hypothetical protein
MKSAARIIVSTFGGLVGLIGAEHGIGAILQGDVSHSGFMFLSWPNSTFFSILGGEPAASILPNLLITGVLAVLFSFAYLVWAVFFIQRKPGGIILILLSIPMFLFGGGIFPPALGMLIGGAVILIDRVMGEEKAHIPLSRSWIMLRALWPWVFYAGVLSWLAMFPVVPLLNYYFGVNDANLVWAVVACMFGFLFLSFVSAVVWDRDRPAV